MPYAVFIEVLYALIGTDKLGDLGRPRSNGSIRMSMKNASKLNKYITKAGAPNVWITVD